MDAFNEDTGRANYPKMLYKEGKFSEHSVDHLIVANELEEEAAFESGFCQLTPVDKSKPKDAKAKAQAVVAAKTGGRK